MGTADAYRAGQALAELTTRFGHQEMLDDAAQRGRERGEQAANRETGLSRRVHVKAPPADWSPDVMRVDLPEGIEAPQVLYVNHLNRTELEVDIAARHNSGTGRHHLYRATRTAAGETLIALVRDGVQLVADLDERGRYVVRGIGDQELAGARTARPSSRGASLAERRPRREMTDAEYDALVDARLRELGQVTP